VSELSAQIQTRIREVATLGTEIDRFRAELRTVVGQFLDNNWLHDIRTARPTMGTEPLPGCSGAPTLRQKRLSKGSEPDEEDASDQSTTEPLMLLTAATTIAQLQRHRWRESGGPACPRGEGVQAGHRRGAGTARD
jgi:hypothetical protein